MRIPGIPALPEGWVEKIIFILWLGPLRAWGFSARMWFPLQQIEYYPRLGLVALEVGFGGFLLALSWPVEPGLVVFMAVVIVLGNVLLWYFVVKHERGHACGIPASGCVGGHKWCVMAEEPMVGHPDGSWRGKAKLLVHQIKGLGRYCGECKKVINNGGNAV